MSAADLSPGSMGPGQNEGLVLSPHNTNAHFLGAGRITLEVLSAKPIKLMGPVQSLSWIVISSLTGLVETRAAKRLSGEYIPVILGRLWG